MEFPRFSDKNSIGPGIWMVIHRLSYLADLPSFSNGKSKYDYISAISMVFDCIQRRFCPNCVGHMRSYLAQHPIPSSFLGEWSNEFHNAVNERTSVEPISYSDFYGFMKYTSLFSEQHKNSPLVRMKSYHDMSPGVWYLIHYLAYCSVYMNDWNAEYKSAMLLILEDCFFWLVERNENEKSHSKQIAKYIQHHPCPYHINEMLMEWTIKVHNQWNTIRGKSIVKPEDVKSYFSMSWEEINCGSC